MRWVIAYDICDPGRLRRTARRLERSALRCQKSVFLFDGDAGAVAALLDEAAVMLDLEQDIIQAWKLAQDGPGAMQCRGAPLNVRPAAVVLTAEERLMIGGEEK
jgi:CRISPR/Cas system-associated endoribonuclease Cas2